MRQGHFRFTALELPHGHVIIVFGPRARTNRRLILASCCCYRSGGCPALLSDRVGRVTVARILKFGVIGQRPPAAGRAFRHVRRGDECSVGLNVPGPSDNGFRAAVFASTVHSGFERRWGAPLVGAYLFGCQCRKAVGQFSELSFGFKSSVWSGWTKQVVAPSRYGTTGVASSKINSLGVAKKSLGDRVNHSSTK